MTTIDKLKKEHKVLKREVAEAEKIRNFARDWSSKQELVDLKKEKLRAKDKIQEQK
tara:strand:+ start:268 stop:435 length:168 start_codon:yes stop_codon:yes gene_type:complete